MAYFSDTIIRLKDQFTPVLKQVKKAAQDYTEISQKMGKDIERSGEIIQGMGQAILPVAENILAMGLASEETGKFAAIMAYTMAESNTPAAVMSEALNEIAPAANAAGISLEETAAAAVILANSAITGNMAGLALTDIIRQLAEPSQQTAEALQQLGMQAVNNQGSFVGFRSIVEQFTLATEGMGEAQKAAYASALVGEKGMTALLAMVEQGVGRFDELHEGIINSSEAAKEMGATMNSGIGGEMADMPLDFIKSLPPEIQSFIVKIAGAGLAFAEFNLAVGDTLVQAGQVLDMLGSVGSSILQAGGLTGFLKGKFAELILSFKHVGMVAKLLFTTPLGLAILVVIGLIVLIVKNWETFGAIFARVGKAIVNEITYIANSIKAWLNQTGITEKISLLWTKLSNLAIRINEALVGILEYVIEIVGSVIGWFAGLWDYLTSGTSVWSNIFLAIFDGTLNNISIIINGLLDVFSGIITFLTGVFMGDWDRAWQGIVDIFGSVFGMISGIAGNVLKTVKDTVNSIIESVNGLSFKVPEWVPEIGGSEFAFNIPMLGEGTDNWRGGLAMVHDKGAEIIDLPRGSRVIPHDKSLASEYQRGMAAGSDGGGNITIAKIADSIIIREDADIDKLARQLVYELKANSINQTAKAF